MRLGKQNQRFPGCFFSSPQDLIHEALQMGYDGVQAIPTRGMSGDEDSVLLYEDAWNAIDTLWAGLRHQPGSEDMPATLNDWVVSPNQAECASISAKFAGRNIPKVVHNFGHAGEILEINSRIDMPLPDIKQKCLDLGMSICIDTLHFQEYLESRFELGEYPEKFKVSAIVQGTVMEKATQLLGDLVTVIHVHSNKTPTEWYCGEGSWLGVPTADIAREFLMRQSPDHEVILVAEYNPGKRNLLYPEKISAMAKQALSDMKRLVDDAEYWKSRGY